MLLSITLKTIPSQLTDHAG